MTTQRLPAKPIQRPLTDAETITTLKGMGFSDDYVATPRRLIVSSSGKTKVGKSHFACSGPPPIIYFDIDVGTEGVLGKFQDDGKQILLYRVRVPKEAKQEVWTQMWEDLKARIKAAYALRAGTLVLDTSSEAYELCRLARFGRLTQVQPHNYTAVNTEWREMLRTAYDSPMNTVFIHKLKAVWMNTVDNNGKLKSTKTNEMELAGFGEMDYAVQINVVHGKEKTENGTVFTLSIGDCRQNPSIEGMQLRGLPIAEGEGRSFDPLLNFDMLLNLVHGDEK